MLSKYSLWKLSVWLLLGALGGVCVAPICAANIEVGADVPAQQRVSVERIDHTPWHKLLVKYVDDRGMVNYAAWQKSAADLAALDAYLQALSTANLEAKASREATLAYWINAYNAVTIKGILREYPTSSIRNHTAKLYGYNIWKNLLLKVDGGTYSLDAIEHQILRKQGEPRIHFAIVCASVGCPPLRNEAYTTDQLDKQLTANAQDFFADPTKFAYDPRSGTFRVSPILDWFGEDFGATTAIRLRAIAPYLPTAEAQRAAQSGAGQFAWLEYDWGLNDQSQVRSAARP